MNKSSLWMISLKTFRQLQTLGIQTIHYQPEMDLIAHIQSMLEGQNHAMKEERDAIKQLLERLPKNFSVFDIEQIKKAYQMAENAHAGQTLPSGLPYITIVLQ
jgi:hypothetical protein